MPVAQFSSDEPTAVGPADFDGDGTLDLAVVAGTRIYVLEGDGTGTFSVAGSPLSVAMPAASVAVGDVSGDGAADIAVIDGPNFSDGQVLVFGGDGALGFSSPQSYPDVSGAKHIRIGQIDGNGPSDIVFAGGLGGPAAIHLMRGGNPPGSPEQLWDSNGLTAIEETMRLGSLDSAAPLDVIMFGALSMSESGWIIVRGGSLDVEATAVLGGWTPDQNQIAVGDFDEGGQDEIFACSSGGGGELFSIAGSGNVNTMGTEVLFDLPACTNVPMTGDFDGNGTADLIFGIGGTLLVAPGGGDGSFGEIVDLGLAVGKLLAVADLDGTGSDDLVTTIDGDLAVVLLSG